MAERDKVGVGLSATALVAAGLLTGTLLRTAPPPTQSAASPPAATARKSDPGESHASSSLAQLRPVMQLLGQSLGISVDPGGQIRAANAALEDSESKEAFPADLQALFLAKKADGTSPCQDASDALPKQWPAFIDLARTGVRSAAGHEDAVPKAYRLKASLAALEACADLAALDDLIKRTEEEAIRIEFLISTVPDYVDSSSGWRADQVLDAIQSAMATDSFTLDRFRLIDWMRSDKQDSATVGGGLLHEKQPGGLIFRRSKSLRVVLLVPETPTGGIHRAALRNAIGFLGAWNARRGKPSNLRIVGPGFSGGVQSLALELKDLQATPSNRWFPEISVISTATADENADLMKRSAPSVQYSTTMRASSQSSAALCMALGEMNKDWRDGRHVALLLESNTVYGNTTQTCQVEFTYHFPLHIAEMMNDSQPTSAATVSLLPSSGVPLNMREATPPADQLPALRPQVTSPVVENQINGILDNLQHEGVSAVGIVATDERDVLFLARLLKRQAPDVQLFFTGNNLLYLHTDYLPYVRGALVASTYPLYLPNQNRPGKRELFQSMVAEGVFNAVQLQMNGATPINGSKPTLWDYCSPSRQSGPCVPPVWISVVGDDGFWPVKTYDDIGSTVMKSVGADGTAARRPLLPLQGPARLLSIIVLLFVYVHAALVGYAWWKGSDARAIRRLQRNPVLRVLAPPITYDAAARRHILALLFGFAVLTSLAVWWLSLLFVHYAVADSGSRLAPAFFTLLLGLPVMLPPLLVALRGPARSVERALPVKAFASPADAGAPCEFPGPIASTNRVSWVPFGMLMCALVIALGAFWRFVWVRVLDPGLDAAQVGFTIDRFASTSIVSPGPAILCLFAAVYVSVFAGLRRISLLGAGYAALASKSGTFRLLAGSPRPLDTGDADPQIEQLPLVCLLDMPAQNLIWPYSLGVVALLAALAWVIPLPSTIEGAPFSIFVTCTSGLIVGSAFLLLAQALEIWRRLRPGLTTLANSRIEPALESVAGVVRWNLSLVSPHLSDLVPLASLADKLYSRLLVLAAGNTHIERGSIERDMAKPANYAELLKKLLKSSGLGVLRADDLTPAADVTRPLLRTLHKEMREQEYAPLLQSLTWFQLWAISDELVILLHRVHWSRFAPVKAAQPAKSLEPTTSHEIVARHALAVAGGVGGDALSLDTISQVVSQTPSVPTASSTDAELKSRRRSVDLWFKDCETLIALQCALVLRDILARVMSCLFTAMTCLTLLTAAHLFYLFQARSSFLTVDLVAVAAAASVSICLLVAMERNTVLSRLRHTTPGTVDINWEFLKRVGIYGVLPLVAVLGSLFPEVQQPIFGWLEPLRRLVNF